MKKIKKTEISTKYLLTNGKFNISATKDINGKISLYKSKYFNQREFCFNNSTPEVIRAVGELLIEASKL